ncbi:MAG: hypothetical protein E4H36_06005 [Spirochaetales bacterium]|nr:MAG: hypothetical protein E4H36_06005 [Spirochaetales bacterium]
MNQVTMKRFLPIILPVLLLLCSAAVFSQETIGQPETADTSQADQLTVGIGGEVSFGFSGFIPGLGLRVLVPLDFGPDSVSLIPFTGFTYLFEVMGDLHSNFYLPLGARLLFNKYGIGLRIEYSLSLLEIFRQGIFNFSLFGRFPIVSLPHFRLVLTFDLGLGLFYGPDYGARALINLTPAVSAWYTF